MKVFFTTQAPIGSIGLLVKSAEVSSDPKQFIRDTQALEKRWKDHNFSWVPSWSKQYLSIRVHN